MRRTAETERPIRHPHQRVISPHVPQPAASERFVVHPVVIAFREGRTRGRSTWRGVCRANDKWRRI